MLAQQLQQAQYQQAPGSAQDSSSQWGAPQGFYNPLAGTPSWDQQSLASTFSTMTLHQPQPSNEWYFDSGATSHMTSQSDILSHTFPCGTLHLHQSLSVMAPCYLSLLLAPQLFILPCILIMFWFLHNLLRILFLFASSLLTTIVPFNLTLLDVM